MKNNKFKKYLEEVHLFSNYQFRKLREEVDVRVKSKRISNILETPKNELICPYCKSKNHIRWGKRSDMQRYKCNDCNKTFNSLTKTPLAKLRRKGHWLQYTNCLKEGLTVREAANRCGVHKTTSFRWRHRFLSNAKSIKAKKLGGIIEVGELTLKESFKGSKNIDFIPYAKRNDIHVIYALDRTNNVFDITNKGLNEKILENEIKERLIQKTLLVSEDKRLYKEFAKLNKLKHIAVVKNKHDLSNTENLDFYKDLFKNWIYKHFRGVATKYLENYVSWFRGLGEFNSGINALTLLYRAKSVEKYRHQPLKVTRFI